jgi:hypothetical protein
LSGNETLNNDFVWPEGTNGFSNDQEDRSEAATALAQHVLGNLKEGEDITLIGHSHGGNVAIQAVNIIKEGLGENDDRAVNLITIATPTYNGSDDPENPANANSDSHVHFYSEFDGVQTTGASSFGSKKASRTYKSSGTTNVKVNDSNLVKMPDPVNPGMTKTGPLGPVESHFIHTRPELLKLD